MRAVVQRVTRAAVTVAGETVGALGPGGVPMGATGQGLLVLVGVTHEDTPQQAATLARKTAELRILTGERGATETDTPVLVVSQFTLYADTRKGRRPSWNQAAAGPVAEPLVEAFAEQLRVRGLRVEGGRFGADMRVELVNDGPMTLILEA